MMSKRMVAFILVLCFLTPVAVYGEAATGLPREKLTNYLLFDMVFSEMTRESELLADLHLFAPMYSDGHWVRTYYSGSDARMRVLTTSPGAKRYA